MNSVLLFERPARLSVDHEALWGGLALAALAAAWSWPVWAAAAPAIPCPMKFAFDIPCVACGGTRAWHALTHGHLAEAFAWNPLAAAIGLAAALYALYALWACATRAPRRLRLVKPRAGRTSRAWLAIRACIVVALVANWAYLIAVGR